MVFLFHLMHGREWGAYLRTQVLPDVPKAQWQKSGKRFAFYRTRRAWR